MYLAVWVSWLFHDTKLKDPRWSTAADDINLTKNCSRFLRLLNPKAESLCNFCVECDKNSSAMNYSAHFVAKKENYDFCAKAKYFVSKRIAEKLWNRIFPCFRKKKAKIVHFELYSLRLSKRLMIELNKGKMSSILITALIPYKINYCVTSVNVLPWVVS